MKRRRRSLRSRVAAWFSLAVGTLVLVTWAVSALLMLRGLRLEIDADLKRETRRVVEHLEQRPDGTLRVRGHYRYDGYGREEAARFLDVLGGDGEVIFHSRRPVSRNYALPASPTSTALELRSLRSPGGLHVRLASRVASVAGRPVTIHLGHSEERIFGMLRKMLVILAITLPLLVAAAGLTGGWLARKALTPVGEMTALARRIHAENLAQRLPEPEVDDELGRLASVLNQMLERVELGVIRLRQFSSDAAHELRTPLAVIKNLAEVVLSREELPARCNDSIASMVEEVDRMSELVEGLLFLSRADAGRVQVRHEPVDLSAVARTGVELMAVLADEKELELVAELDTPGAVVGDEALLRQAVVNLLHNAIKYTDAPGEIRVTVAPSADDEGVALTVRDTGVGIDLAAHPELFERFYRVEESRSRDGGGVGLGLAISRWIAESHGGELRVESAPRQGSTFTLFLPAA